MTTIMVIASPISTSRSLCTSSVSSNSKSTISSLSPLVFYPKASNIRVSKLFPQLGPAIFSQWSGLRHLGISISPKSLRLEKRRRCKANVVHASLFGVGAPEALVIGVVALLVFGPKGLAEVARNLGKTLRAFQPTIRELQEVSREFKSTLEREIGLDEMTNTTQNTLNRNSPYLSNSTLTPSSVANTEESGTKAEPSNSIPTSSLVANTEESGTKAEPSNSIPTSLSVASTGESGTKAEPNGTPSAKEAYTSEEYLKITEEQLKAAASQQQGQPASPGESQLESQNQQEATSKETAAAMPPTQKPESGT